jgi:hypothetical protein
VPLEEEPLEEDPELLPHPSTSSESAINSPASTQVSLEFIRILLRSPREFAQLNLLFSGWSACQPDRFQGQDLRPVTTQNTGPKT